jgi:flavin-dependent dehydrogenase
VAQRLSTRHYDAVIMGGGPAGVAAAIAATRNGARTLLVGAGSFLGGDLVSACLSTAA